MAKLLWLIVCISFTHADPEPGFISLQISSDDMPSGPRQQDAVAPEDGSAKALSQEASRVSEAEEPPQSYAETEYGESRSQYEADNGQAEERRQEEEYNEGREAQARAQSKAAPEANYNVSPDERTEEGETVYYDEQKEAVADEPKGKGKGGAKNGKGKRGKGKGKAKKEGNYNRNFDYGDEGDGETQTPVEAQRAQAEAQRKLAEAQQKLTEAQRMQAGNDYMYYDDNEEEQGTQEANAYASLDGGNDYAYNDNNKGPLPGSKQEEETTRDPNPNRVYFVDYNDINRSGRQKAPYNRGSGANSNSDYSTEGSARSFGIYEDKTEESVRNFGIYEENKGIYY